MTGSDDIGICPGDGPDCRGPVPAGGRSRLSRRVPTTEGSARGLASPDPGIHRGDHGQDLSTPRRTAHVRRRARARRPGAGRLRAAEAAAGERAAADLHSEQPGGSARSRRGRTHGSEHEACRPDPGPVPAPACVPICPPSDPGTVQPFAQAAQRCIRIPIPCLPGFEIPHCVNFCPPGQDPPAQETANLEPARELARCTPLCVLIPRGSPGACDMQDPLPRN